MLTKVKIKKSERGVQFHIDKKWNSECQKSLIYIENQIVK